LLEAEILSTDGQERWKGKVEYFRHAIDSTFGTRTVYPIEPRNFWGRLRRADLAGIKFAEVTSSGAHVHHTHVHMAHAKHRDFLLRLQLTGSSTSMQGGHEARLQPGDFTLCDTARPYDLLVEPCASQLILRIPATVLKEHFCCPEAITARAMRGCMGYEGLVSRFIQDVWHHSDEFLGLEIPGRLSHTLCDLIAAAYASMPEDRFHGSTVVTAQYRRIIDYIEGHLSDSNLSLDSIATALRITPRYVHRLFYQKSGQTPSETVGRYILRRRLEQCARALTDPLQCGRKISEIAFNHGFNSFPHFCKVFRTRYGQSPTRYRLHHDACKSRSNNPSL